MQIPLFHVDAFTDDQFHGNPAAVCILNSWLDDDVLRKVAAENNLSETAFLVPRGEGYELRWFTPVCEVRLCGHATLASAYVAFHVLQPGIQRVAFETRFSGTLAVKDEGTLLAMDLPAIAPRPHADIPKNLLLALGTASIPVAVLEADEVYIVTFENQSAIQNIHPNFRLLEQLHPYAVAVTAPGSDADFVSRYFAPSYGVPEDPVTGSAHCSLAPYWSQRLNKSILRAQQLSPRGGNLLCEIAENRVVLKGAAVEVLRGMFTI